MSEKLVLPKFHIPRRGPHWMVWALGGVAALVVIQIVVFGVIALRHHGDPVAATDPPAPAPVRAQEPPVVPAITAPAAPVPSASRPTMTGGMPPPTELPGRKIAARHRVHAHAPGRSGKGLAKAGVVKHDSDPKSDALDDLLRKFK